MLPVQIAGLALSGRMLLSKYGYKPLKIKRIRGLKTGNVKNLKIRKIKLSTGLRNIRKLTDTLAARLNKPSQKTEAEDYEKIASGFIPEGSRLLVPKFPSGSPIIQKFDLDRDSVNELIGTYSQNGKMHTMILKKAGSKWVRSAIIEHTGMGQLEYRGVADLAGDGRNQLLLGISGKGKSSLLGYSLWDGRAEVLFERPYNRFELMENRTKKSRNNPVPIAIWEKDKEDIYDVRLHRFDGSRLNEEPVSMAYWQNRVLPVYALQVKNNPYSPEGWYTLARALKKAGLRSDTIIAVETGLRMDKNGALKERFEQLRKELQ